MATKKDTPKVVRLRNTLTGVVVQTTEDNAGRLSGFEADTKRSSAKSDDK